MASESVWEALQLPLAVKDTLKRMLSPSTKGGEVIQNASNISELSLQLQTIAIDQRRVSQVDVVVFDISLSMKSKRYSLSLLPQGVYMLSVSASALGGCACVQ